MNDEAAVPTRRGPFLPSVLAGLAILLWIVGSSFLFELIGAFPLVTGMPTGFPESLNRFLDPERLVVVAFSLGAAVSFWLVAPIIGRLGPAQVVRRALVATVVAAVVMYPLEFVVMAQQFAEFAAQQAGNSALVDVSPDYTPTQAAAYSASEVVTMAIARLPLIVLAALASWAWQRRSTAHGQA